MTDMTIEDLAGKMSGIDFAMLVTRTDGDQLASRPMSNNGEVEYDGDSYYFTYDRFRSVADITRDPKVGLTFARLGGLLASPFFVAVEGSAELIRDKGRFEEHWHAGLDRWFEQGPDTPGVVLIKVHAIRLHYWDGEDEGEVTV